MTALPMERGCAEDNSWASYHHLNHHCKHAGSRTPSMCTIESLSMMVGAPFA